MVNPDAGRDIMFQQLQRNQSSVQPRRNSPFDQIAGNGMLKQFVERFNTRVQQRGMRGCLFMLQRTRRLQLLLQRVVGKLRRD